jgi:diaminopimelate epimerase
VLTLQLEVEGGKVEQVTVDMGEPILQADQIPTTLQGPWVFDRPLPPPWNELATEPWAQEAGWDGHVTCVSMGNPHVVLYCKDLGNVPLEQVGPILENADLFPRRINVHFVQVESSQEVTMLTWERGSGITLACGTGACAVVVAGILTGRTERRLLAHLPGGDLRLHWSKSNDHVHMTGSATEVFRGEWPD